MNGQCGRIAAMRKIETVQIVEESMGLDLVDHYPRRRDFRHSGFLLTGAGIRATALHSAPAVRARY